MYRWFAMILVMLAPLAEARTDLLDPAWETRDNITARLAQCGTEEFSADDPRLPSPRVPAHRAYVAENGLAGYHYRRTLNFAQDFRWIRPNGGAVAWMTVIGDEELEFGTTTGGTQARMSRYFTPAGEFFNYWCGSQQVNEAVFRECVEQRWVQYLLTAFCAPR